MSVKVIIYLLFILFVYRSLSRIFSIPKKSTNTKRNNSGKQIDYKDVDFEEVD